MNWRQTGGLTSEICHACVTPANSIYPKIPIIRDDTRNRADLQRYFGASEPKAIAIHPWGELFIASGSKDAQETVLNNCNNFGRDKPDGPCLLYAINTKVVLPERLIRPK